MSTKADDPGSRMGVSGTAPQLPNTASGNTVNPLAAPLKPDPAGMTGAWSAQNWKALLEAAPEPIVIFDPKDKQSVVYANPAFGRMCNSTPEKLIGTQLQALQAATTERPSQGLPSWVREDRLTGLFSRGYFEEVLRRDWAAAQRDGHEIAFALFDIDELGAYNETFDFGAGDACIRRVARVIGAAYRRGSDLVGRWEGGTVAVLMHGDSIEKALSYAQTITQRVREQLIHHPRAASGRYVTVSVGVGSVVPPRGMPLETFLEACQSALLRSKRQGKNCASGAVF